MRRLLLLAVFVACGTSNSGNPASPHDGGSGDAAIAPSDGASPPPPPPFDAGMTPSGPYGNPNGHCTVPAAAALADVSHPTTVVGTGTAASCTADAVVAAVHAGGVVTFDCGAAPLTITVPEIDIFNDGGATKDGSVTIDGGGLDHAERRRQEPHPLPEHLRLDPPLHHDPLPGSARAAPRAPEHRVHGGQRDGDQQRARAGARCTSAEGRSRRSTSA